jgi:hypothetical protein
MLWFAQAVLRNVHPRPRLKRLLLTSKDRNGTREKEVESDFGGSRLLMR